MRGHFSYINEISISDFGIKIAGRGFEPFFKLEQLIEVVGEPDERAYVIPSENLMEACSWNELGLRTLARCHDKESVQCLYVCKKEIPNKKIKPFLGRLLVDGKPICKKPKAGVYETFLIEKNIILVEARNGLEICDDDDANYLAIEFREFILLAVHGNWTKRLKQLVDDGHDINCVSGRLEDPLLTVAIIKGFYDIAKILVKAGADVNKKNNVGTTPLIEAAIRGEMECAKLLIDAGADLTLRDNKGFTALELAKMHGAGEEMVRLLEG